MTLTDLIESSKWLPAIRAGGVAILNQLIARNNLPLKPVDFKPGETWEVLRERCTAIALPEKDATITGTLLLTRTAWARVISAQRSEMLSFRGYYPDVDNEGVSALLQGVPTGLASPNTWPTTELIIFNELLEQRMAERFNKKTLTKAGAMRMVTRIKRRLNRRRIISASSVAAVKIRKNMTRCLVNAMLMKQALTQPAREARHMFKHGSINLICNPLSKPEIEVIGNWTLNEVRYASGSSIGLNGYQMS